MPAPHPHAGESVALSCACGWQGSLPATASGVTVECPKCGRNILVPAIGSLSSESRADIALIEKLTGRRFIEGETPSLKPLLIASMAALIASPLLALIFTQCTFADFAAAIGGGAAWLFSLWLAAKAVKSQHRGP